MNRWIMGCKTYILAASVLMLVACSGLKEKQAIPDFRSIADLSKGHIQKEPSAKIESEVDGSAKGIPEPVRIVPSLPTPNKLMDEVTHTIVVFDVPVRELLFSLARDAGLELDIDPEITQLVTMNAIDQPIDILLERIASSAGLSYEIHQNVLKIKRDLPYLESYALNFLNMSRTSTGSVGVSTQIQATGQGSSDDGGGSESGGNNSDTSVSTLSEHNFWESLSSNLDAILAETSAVDDEQTATVSNNVIINRESGIVFIRATRSQHTDIRHFINLVENSTQRQVMIEATIAEVTLNETYQAGIDWQLINSQTSSGIELTQDITGVSLAQPPTFNLSVSDLSFGGNELQATLSALETFGDVSVVSSPKIMAMNNQTAILKVVDNLIYFTVDVNIDNATGTAGGGRLVTFETDVNTVPVGFVMSVTPFIGVDDLVTLNVRPTISRVIDFVTDPNPQLAQENVVSQIPVIQAREVESVLKVASGDVAVIGGLMQDQLKRNTRGVPLMGRLPFVGSAFRYDDNETTKTELVIFIRPKVIKNASIEGDLSQFRKYLPTNQ
ncbi:MAG: MSHA type pilus biogenesis protein MshL [Candidatus Azotimanducaceae bacterium]|jgi:MSHA type pilus biogenesis protein MshL